MRHTVVTVLVVGVVVGFAAAAAAQQTSAGGSLSARPWFSSEPQAPKPLGDLFPKRKPLTEKQLDLLAAAARQRRFGQLLQLPAQSTVVCGMTLVPADPTIDPTIRHAPPADGQLFAMSKIVPRDCQKPEDTEKSARPQK
jgi:hypothetical protein